MANWKFIIWKLVVGKENSRKRKILTRPFDSLKFMELDKMARSKLFFLNNFALRAKLSVRVIKKKLSFFLYFIS